MSGIRLDDADQADARDAVISLCVTSAVIFTFATLASLLAGAGGMSRMDAILCIGLPAAFMMAATLLSVPQSGRTGRRLSDAAGCSTVLAAICLAAGISDVDASQANLHLMLAIVGGGIACSFLLGLIASKDGPAPPMTYLSLFTAQLLIFSLVL